MNATLKTLRDAAATWNMLDEDDSSEMQHNAVLGLEKAARDAMQAGATRAEVLRAVGDEAADMLAELI